MTATTLTPATTPTPAPLTLADRCDLCGAQAFVRAILATGELLFCAHHGTKFEFSLVEQGAEIYRQPVWERKNDTDH